MRPIDADALFEHKVYAETPTISGDFVPGFVIDRAPTIDAVPVIRCKDCAHWKPCEKPEFAGHKYCEWAGWLFGENAYCAYGEKEA